MYSSTVWNRQRSKGPLSHPPPCPPLYGATSAASQSFSSVICNERNPLLNAFCQLFLHLFQANHSINGPKEGRFPQLHYDLIVLLLQRMEALSPEKLQMIIPRHQHRLLIRTSRHRQISQQHMPQLVMFRRSVCD